eukprot:TRINITY_DN52809_c0_g1_i1.p1 TRINITY_DN52809_c0_g1~~TRINITY_DN52809_c0_g1_i1.p1  ORF type:complete len:260 (-),score=85.31 TRINITY_DN52809_c0_g1_i1:147-926(-)
MPSRLLVFVAACVAVQAKRLGDEPPDATSASALLATEAAAAGNEATIARQGAPVAAVETAAAASVALPEVDAKVLSDAASKTAPVAAAETIAGSLSGASLQDEVKQTVATVKEALSKDAETTSAQPPASSEASQAAVATSGEPDVPASEVHPVPLATTPAADSSAVSSTAASVGDKHSDAEDASPLDWSSNSSNSTEAVFPFEKSAAAAAMLNATTGGSEKAAGETAAAKTAKSAATSLKANYAAMLPPMLVLAALLRL